MLLQRQQTLRKHLVFLRQTLENTRSLATKTRNSKTHGLAQSPLNPPTIICRIATWNLHLKQHMVPIQRLLSRSFESIRTESLCKHAYETTRLRLAPCLADAMPASDHIYIYIYYKLGSQFILSCLTN